ncbi:MAG: right-handed parallel beta-helix repeat-containing protein [Planctomycetota bacterium]
MSRSLSGLGVATLWLLYSVALHAASYHVDYVGGNDTADGNSPQTAWKHCPGDPTATGVPAGIALAPGDTILFKGGVAYQGTIKLTASGAPGRPITLDANTAGGYGSGRAVIDGGQVLNGWRRYGSAEEAQGHPRWGELFYIDVDLDIIANFNHGAVVAHRQEKHDRQAPWQRIILSDGDSHLLPIAQFPKPSDRFYPDLPKDFLKSPNRLVVKDGVSAITDAVNLTTADPNHYRGAFLGVHGGNNHVYFAAVTGYEPAEHRVTFAQFKPTTYPTTSYCFYNTLRLISEPGEWCIAPIGDKRFRVSLLPERLVAGLPANIGFPALESGIAITDGASHLAIRGFLIQRFSGGTGGISVARHEKRSTGITVANCEIRFVSGHGGIGLNYCDDIAVDNCYIHHCPAWTTAVFLSRVNRFAVRDCRLEKNSGSGIRHYECKDGKLTGNAILDHYGMHSSSVNFYEGCADLLFEGNYLHNTLAINRNAERIVIRNNVIDSQGRAAVNVAMWTSGTVGGKAIKDIHILNNTFINLNHEIDYSTSVFGQRGKGASPPTGLVVSNNVLDRLTDGLPGKISGNIYMREVGKDYLGDDGQVVADPAVLFVDPAKGDFRRRPSGPVMTAGANIPPPPATWGGPR